MPTNDVQYPVLPDFSSMTSKERGLWFNQYYPAYLSIASERLSFLLSDANFRDKPVGRNSFSTEVKKYVGMFFSKRSPSSYPMLALVSFAGANISGESCHSVVFSEHKDVDVWGGTAYFLEQFASAAPSVQNQILSVLQDHVSPNYNPLSILATRCTEIAHSYGIPFTEYIRQRFSYSTTNAAANGKFLNATFDQDTHFSNRFEMGLYNSIFRIASYLAVIDNYSLDYLLLQDYSHVAYMNGQPLPDLLREVLSLYLCSDVSGKQEALRLLLYPLLFP